MVPYNVNYLTGDRIAILAVMSHEEISKAVSNKLEIDILPLDISVEDPMYVSIDRIDDHTPEKLRGLKILSSDGHRLLVALDPSTTNDSVPFHDMHGHFLFLIPNPTL